MLDEVAVKVEAKWVGIVVETVLVDRVRLLQTAFAGCRKDLVARLSCVNRTAVIPIRRERSHFMETTPSIYMSSNAEKEAELSG
jgi:hypothetical protein